MAAAGTLTLLLGNYLTEQGMGDFEYIAGERGNKAADPPTWMSHAWIRQGRIVIDITADQFPEVAESVIITERLAVACHVQPGRAASGGLPGLRRIHQIRPRGGVPADHRR